VEAARRVRRRSVEQVLLFALVVGTLVPFLPLGLLTWLSYREELARFEEAIQAGNSQIAHLAATHLSDVLREAQRDAAIAATQGTAWLPSRPEGVHWERVTGDGTVLESLVDPARKGRRAAFAALLDASAPLLMSEVTPVGPWIEGLSPMFLLITRIDDAPTFLVAALDSTLLRTAMAAAPNQPLNRHIYAVDSQGTLIFYSTPEVLRAGQSLRANPPVALHVGGGQGPIRFRSVVSGKERLGFVQRLEPSGLGVIVSADIGTAIVDLRKRYGFLGWAIGFAIVSAVGIFWWTSHRIARPVVRIVDALRGSPAGWRGALAVDPAVRKLREHDELVVAFDALTERYLQTERELVRAEKSFVVSQMASGIAHQVGTPLNVIKGNAQYLLKKLEPNHPVRQELQLIVSQAERISSMIRQVLEFSRPMEPKRIPVRLQDIVAKCLQMTASLSDEAVRVETDIESDTPAVLADPRLLEHVVLNIIANAYQAMPRGGRLAVTLGTSLWADTDDATAWVCCRIADTGTGIEPQVLTRIFEPFFSTKPHGKGTGLGLAIVERIVAQHNGRITVSSRPGQSTVFALQFRAAPEPSLAVPAEHH
jgi:signal transduction histidine kinase